MRPDVELLRCGWSLQTSHQVTTEQTMINPQAPDILCINCGRDQQPCYCRRRWVLRSGDVPSVKPE